MMPGEDRRGYHELLKALEKCAPDDPKPLLDCFLEHKIDPVLTCVVIRKLYRYGYDSCGKTLDYLQKFKDHPSEYHTKEDWRASVDVPQKPQEAIRADAKAKEQDTKPVASKTNEATSWLQDAMF